MTFRADVLSRLPEELKERPQWALAGASKAPLTVTNNGTLQLTAVTRPGEWLTFEQALYYAQLHQNDVTVHTDKQGNVIQQVGYNIGYILNEADPLTCIDLDVKDSETHPRNPELWTSQEDKDRYESMVQSFDTYTERSRSGKGYHIWALGKIGKGFRRDGVEVYSQERFIISTGNVVNAIPPQDRQWKLNNMVSLMRPVTTSYVLSEEPEEEGDYSILKKAINAQNADKFAQLWAGDWQAMGYPSQSEADLSLMSMLTFYSPSNAQCRRIFRTTRLGQREKAQKNDDYLNRTLIQIRSRMEREQRAEQAVAVRSIEIAQQIANSENVVHMVQPEQPSTPPITTERPAEVVVPVTIPSAVQVTTPEDLLSIAWPPGGVGEVAKYIYATAQRPFREAAIVAALGLFSGLCGKAWNVSGTGLNTYTILIARSGSGKEAMHNGIDRITAICTQRFPRFANFVTTSSFASGQALIKGCLVNQCFLNANSEWGRQMLQMAEDKSPNTQSLRTEMVKLYSKSGPDAMAGGISYSTADNNVSGVRGVAYSMIGESTPKTLYKSLTSSMMEDGFLSRFLILQYDGPRPPENENTGLMLPENEIYRLCYIASKATQLNTDGTPINVQLDPQAREMYRQYSAHCDRSIDAAGDDESHRQMWNRAALKVLKISALLAVADWPDAPVVNAEHMQWALNVVNLNVRNMMERLNSGDVGDGDDSRELKLRMILRDYAAGKVSNSYRISSDMIQMGIVLHRYLFQRVRNQTAFTNHRLGAKKALEDTISLLIQTGVLTKMKSDAMDTNGFSFSGEAYRIVNVP